MGRPCLLSLLRISPKGHYEREQTEDNLFEKPEKKDTPKLMRPCAALTRDLKLARHCSRTDMREREEKS